MPTGDYIKDDYDGTTPLRDADEVFCLRVASGVLPVQAAREAFGKQVTASALRMRATRMIRIPGFAKRIEHLRKENAPVAENAPPFEMTRAGMIKMMAETTDAISTAITALEGVGTSPRTLSKMRRELVTHVGRLDRLQPVHEAETCDSDLTPFLRQIANIPRCSCGYVHGDGLRALLGGS